MHIKKLYHLYPFILGKVRRLSVYFVFPTVYLSITLEEKVFFSKIGPPIIVFGSDLPKAKVWLFFLLSARLRLKLTKGLELLTLA